MLAQLAIAVTLADASLRALDVEHRIAMVLQQQPAARRHRQSSTASSIAFRYLAASPQAEVGGDFYEAFVLDASGRWRWRSATSSATRCGRRR